MSAIVSPVSRAIDVADVARSVAFYRDVLGFAETPIGRDSGVDADAQVVRGPARLQFVRSAIVHPSVLFFEADSVAALREEIARRGGRVSDLVDVNWIKMRMFEVRDPDGHVLWFGTSFNVSGMEKPRGQLEDALPILPVDDVAGAIAHYVDVLGFGINYRQDDLGVMYRDRVTVLLVQRTAAGVGACEFYIADADSLHAELTAKGANVLGAPVSHPWGLRDFVVVDPAGNRLVFAQPFE